MENIYFTFTTSQKNLYDKIVSFAQDELGTDLPKRDINQTFDRVGWDKCGEMGLTGLTISSNYGGRELDVSTSAAALIGLGYGCKDNGLNFAIGAHLWGCVTPLNLYGTVDQKMKFLPDLCSGKKIGALAVTEPEAGSDVSSIQTIARQVNDGYELTGKKVLITNAPLADVFICNSSIRKHAREKRVVRFYS